MEQQYTQEGGSKNVPSVTFQEASALMEPQRKRQKRTASTPPPPAAGAAASAGRPPNLSRKGKACINCRKLKVKCDSADRGLGDCSRCVRLGLKCLSERQVWATADEVSQAKAQLQHQQHTDAAIVKVERALEDVLEKLGMPALELYAPQAIVTNEESPRSTRRNSREPGSSSTGPGNGVHGAPGEADRAERDLSPGPMRSLIEATRLDGLWSQLRSGKQRRKGGMRRMDFDLVSENIISHAQAEEMFRFFMANLSPYLFSASIPQDSSLESIRTSSTVLFTAIMLVSALHVPDHEHIHEACHSRFLGLVSSALFDRFHTLDDIRGLCIAALWQPALSWKLSGICIRMATELSLHHAFYEAFYMPDADEQARKESLEKARLWYLLFVLDHQSSIAYGRPPVMAELRPIKDYDVLLRSPYCTPQDRALIVQVTACVTLSKAFETFGLEPKRTMGGDDATVLSHLHFVEEARTWRERWQRILLERNAAEEQPFGQMQPQQEAVIGGHDVVDLHYRFSELVLYSLVLRGRSLEDLASLPSRLRPLTLKAIEAAHMVLERFTEDNSALRAGLVGMPLYLHAMIAFAVVFLMKLQHRWHLIGITVDPVQRTFPVIQTIVGLLRACKAGSDHIVFSMANGFERLLKQASRQRKAQQASARVAHLDNGDPAAVAAATALVNGPANGQQQVQGQLCGSGVNDQGVFLGPATLASGYHQVLYDGVNESPQTEQTHAVQSATSGVSPFETWDFQDQEFWNLGFDLLAPRDDGSLGLEFPGTFE